MPAAHWSAPPQPGRNAGPTEGLGLAKTAPCAANLGAAPLPVTLVRLAGAPAPMLIPGAVTPLNRNPFRTYLQKLAKVHAFPDQKQDIAKLERLPSQVEMTSTARPWVAIMVSEPCSLLPGEFETLSVLADLVRKRGCEPVLVPPMLDLVLPKDREARLRGIESMGRRFKGVIGPGGADVHPRIYKSRITHAVDPVYPRDRFESDFVAAVMQGDAFGVGFCRSHQLWNAATGGKLVQDVELDGLSNISQDQDKFGIPRSEPFVVRNDKGEVVFENRVELAPGSQIADLLGEASVLTNSLHHQAVEKPGRGFRVTGLVPDPVTGKDTIEATESWNAIATQFHPELMLADERFLRLVETVARRAHIFFQLDRLKTQGEVKLERLVEAVQTATQNGMTEVDRTWMATELAPRLGA